VTPPPGRPDTGRLAAARLERGLTELDYPQPAALASRLLDFGDLLLAANRRTNLIGARDIDGLVAAHFLDSLAPLARGHLASPALDVGSGAGLPGIPVALAFPDLSITLLEPRAKRAAFLRSVVADLELRNVEVVQMGAERAGRREWRDRGATVLARALAKATAALELALPLVRPAGRLYLYTGREKQPAPNELEMIERLQAALVEARPVAVPYLDAQRHVWIIEKRGPTPEGIPASSRARRKAER
jgi:16S rRNA (guanine527-N7)-methyltransferase